MDDFGMQNAEDSDHSIPNPLTDESHMARVRGWGGSMVGEDELRRIEEEKVRREEIRRKDEEERQRVREQRTPEPAGTCIEGTGHAGADNQEGVGDFKEEGPDGWMGWMGSMIMSAVSASTFGLVSPRNRSTSGAGENEEPLSEATPDEDTLNCTSDVKAEVDGGDAYPNASAPPSTPLYRPSSALPGDANTSSTHHFEFQNDDPKVEENEEPNCNQHHLETYENVQEDVTYW